MFNGDFFSIETRSGWLRSRDDPEGAQHLLAPSASDLELGTAVLDALAKSRMVTHDDAPEVFDIDLAQERYTAWVAMLIARYGYKGRRTLFNSMKFCDLESKDGVLRIRPWHHERSDRWSGKGITAEHHVALDAHSPPEAVGAGLRLAFRRCT
jgi:hypothetical protein